MIPELIIPAGAMIFAKIEKIIDSNVKLSSNSNF